MTWFCILDDNGWPEWVTDSTLFDLAAACDGQGLPVRVIDAAPAWVVPQ